MKLEVPFYNQTTKLNCWPTALRMVFSYFDEDLDINVIEKEVGIKEGKIVSTIQLAIASARLGFKTGFFSKNLSFNEEHKKMDFYKKYSIMNVELIKKLVKKARGLGVNVNEKSITLEDFISLVSPESIPIILLDWNVITNNRDGYLGHFVPVVGYNNDNIYVHNQGPKNPTPFLAIKKDVFDLARKAEGTDEDIVVIYKK